MAKSKCKFGNDTCNGINGDSMFICNDCVEDAEFDKAKTVSVEFNEDLIVRGDLPCDVFELIHDLAYDHEGRDRSNYMHRAQKILQTVPEVAPSDIDRAMADVEQKHHVLSVWGMRLDQASEAVKRANKLYWDARRRLSELKENINDTEKP